MPYDVLDPTLAQPAPISSAGAPLTDVGMTLEEFIEELQLMLGNRSDVLAGGTYEDRLTRWLNWGYNYTASILDLKELWGSVEIPLIADQHLYAVPDNLAWIKKMVLQDDTDYELYGGIELDQIDIDTYRTLPDSDEVQTSGTSIPPKKYFRYGRMVVLWPTPAIEYTSVADFRVRVADMTDPDHSPILPPEFHESILLAGLARAQRQLGLHDKALLTQNNFKAALAPLINSDAEERAAMHMVAQPIGRKIQLFRGQ